MAITTSGTITFQQPGTTLYAKMHLPRAASFAALRTFANALADYTEASIIAVSFSQEESIDDLTGDGNDVLERHGMLLFRGEETKSKNFAIPAPKENLFEVVEFEGLKIKKTKGEALAEAYSALTGETFTFVRGRLLGG